MFGDNFTNGSDDCQGIAKFVVRKCRRSSKPQKRLKAGAAFVILPASQYRRLELAAAVMMFCGK
jgi:hypothetical protein